MALTRSGWYRWVIAAAVAVVAAVAYAPADRLPFVNYDDNEYVRNNQYVLHGLSIDTVRWAFTTAYDLNYHPLTWVSLAIDASLSLPDLTSLSRTMHRTNVALHAATAAALFLLLATSTGADGAAAFAAAVFAAHPAHVESVAWVSERKDVLCGLFYLLAVAAHMAFARATTARRRRIAYTMALLAGTAALLSKPMAVTLPVVLFAVDYWPLRRFAWGPTPSTGTLTVRRAVVEQFPLIAVSAILCWVTFAAQAAAGAVQTIGDRPLSARVQHVPVNYVRYLGKIVWPTGLSAYYPYYAALPLAEVVGSAILLAAVTWVALRYGRRFPYLTFGWIWFGVTLGPVVGIIPAGRQSIADRYLYLPLIGPVVMVAWAGRDLVRRSTALRVRGARAQFGAARPVEAPEVHPGLPRGRRVIAHGYFGAVAGVAVVVASTIATRHQLGYWRDTRTLFAHALDVDPNNAFAHAQLGYLDKVDGQMATARWHYEQAVRLDPQYGDATYNLANMVLPTDPIAAARYYRMTLAVRPHDPRVENNLGVALSADPARAAEAAALFRAAAADDPGWADPHVNLGHLFLAHGRPDLAAAEFALAGHHP